MATNYETGHANNLSSFALLLDHCNELGKTYQPARTALGIAELKQQYQSAREALQVYIDGKTTYKNTINDRKDEFKELNTIVTRLLAACRSLNIEEHTLSNARLHQARLQGRRLGKIEKPVTGTESANEASHQISVSRRSYTSKAEHFARIIAFVKGLPQYATNEPDLSIAALENKLARLEEANNNVSMEWTRFIQARSLYLHAIYERGTGLISVAYCIKDYLGSVLGTGNENYLTIRSIPFKRRKLS